MDPDQADLATTTGDALPEALASLQWDNRFVDQLPVDPETAVRPRQVSGALSSRVTPVTASAPVLVAHSPEVAAGLGLDERLWSEHR